MYVFIQTTTARYDRALVIGETKTSMSLRFSQNGKMKEDLIFKDEITKGYRYRD
jgi:hypothetical protein